MSLVSRQSRHCEFVLKIFTEFKEAKKKLEKKYFLPSPSRSFKWFASVYVAEYRSLAIQNHCSPALEASWIIGKMRKCLSEKESGWCEKSRLIQFRFLLNENWWKCFNFTPRKLTSIRLFEPFSTHIFARDSTHCANSKFICYPTISFICRLFRPPISTLYLLTMACAFASRGNGKSRVVRRREWGNFRNFMHNSREFSGALSNLLLNCVIWIIYYYFSPLSFLARRRRAPLSSLHDRRNASDFWFLVLSLACLLAALTCSIVCRMSMNVNLCCRSMFHTSRLFLSCMKLLGYKRCQKIS